MKKILLFLVLGFNAKTYSSNEKHFVPFGQGPRIQRPELQQSEGFLELLRLVPSDLRIERVDLERYEILYEADPGLKLTKIIRTIYGEYGVVTFSKIMSILREISPASKVIYNPDKNLFEISNSDTLTEELVQEALDAVKYIGWRPKVKKQTSSNNLFIYLVEKIPSWVDLDQDIIWGHKLL